RFVLTTRLPPPPSSLFPYTTLFRSPAVHAGDVHAHSLRGGGGPGPAPVAGRPRCRRRSDFPRRPLPHPMDGTMELNYAAYLKLAQLLDLQEPRSQPEEHDEMLFIVIHQVYELWFKLL